MLLIRIRHVRAVYRQAQKFHERSDKRRGKNKSNEPVVHSREAIVYFLPIAI